MNESADNGLVARLATVILVASWAILPLQWFWLRLVEAHGISVQADFLLTQWYEGLIWLVGLLALVNWLITSHQIRLTIIDWLALGMFAYAWLTLLWSRHGLGYQLIGLRFSLMAVYGYFLGRLANLSESTINRILTTIFWLTIGLGVLQLLLWLVAPTIADALALGITHRAASLPQLYGSLIGPNQFGLYLVLIAVISFWRRLPSYLWLVILALSLLALSVSRSAMLAGLIILLVGLIVDRSRRIELKKIALGVVVTAVVIGGLALVLVPRSSIQAVLTHGQSDVIRVGAVGQGLARFRSGTAIQKLFGHGVGESGPATFTRPPIFITENWYVQILYEYGVVGSLIFLAFLIGLIVHHWQRNKSVAFGVLGFMIVSFFLLPLGDNPAAMLLVFGLAGVSEPGRLGNDATI